MNNKNLFSLFFELWHFLSLKRKLHLILVMMLSILAALSEMVSIASILPFLFILVGNEHTEFSKLPIDFTYLLSFFNLQNEIIFLASFFIAAVILSGIIRVLLIWTQGMFSALAGVELSTSLLDRHLSKEFEYHQNSNSGEIIAIISQKTTVVVFQIILPTLAITANVTIALGIVISLLLINAEVTMITFAIFAGIYFGLYLFTSKKLNTLSLIINENLNTTLKTLQEMLRGLKDVLIYNARDSYRLSFNTKNLALRNAQAMSYVIGNSPKYIIETISICIFILIVIFFNNPNSDNQELIPVLGAFALAANKLLPALQQIYSALSSIRSSDAVFRNVIAMLRADLSKNQFNRKYPNIKFQDNITLENVSLKFVGQQNYVLKNIDLKINRGDFIGIVGKTGSGKSSLVNLIMGFYSPSEGELFIDREKITNANFERALENFSYVSQELFLFDGSIQENIAFGIAIENIDKKKLDKAIEVSKLESFIQKCPNGLQTGVGELGTKISGGEKQRIAIARALYKDAPIIIFDEATSALDYQIENEIINSIVELNKDYTIVTIAHRLYTLEKCDSVYQISEGKLSLKKLSDL